MSVLPHSDSENDRYWIMRTIKEAEKASLLGESPFGSLIVAHGKLIASAHNMTISKCDPRAHAEIIALDMAIPRVDLATLESATLYSNCAPCIMCLGTAYYSGIRRIVYALRISDVVDLGSGDPNFEPQQLIAAAGLGVQCLGDICRSEALKSIEAHYRRAGKI